MKNIHERFALGGARNNEGSSVRIRLKIMNVGLERLFLNKNINFDSKISAIFPRLPKHHANPILTKAFLKQKVNTRFIIINSRLSVCENEWKIT
jgi:hypothetical protein